MPKGGKKKNNKKNANNRPPVGTAAPTPDTPDPSDKPASESAAVAAEDELILPVCKGPSIPVSENREPLSDLRLRHFSILFLSRGPYEYR